MGNTNIAKQVMLSNHIYKEWYPKTVLVQSCDNSFEGEFDLDKREIDIPIYHDLQVYQTSLAERDIQPVKPEFIKASVKRVTIDKGRYSHFAETSLDKLVDRLTKESSQAREKLVKKWAVEAEEELALYCAKLPAKQTIDMKTALTDTGNTNGLVTKDNILRVLDILKAKAEANKMEPTEFSLFVSTKFGTILRDTKITFGSTPADAAFTAGFVANADGVDIRRHQVAAISKRNATTSEVESEWGIWKTKDGIQYVIPYKNTVSYDITPDKVLGGGKGYQILEYYDFFNLYPNRLYKVKLQYAGTTWSTIVTGE